MKVSRFTNADNNLLVTNFLDKDVECIGICKRSIGLKEARQRNRFEEGLGIKDSLKV